MNNMLIIWPKGGFYRFFSKKMKKSEIFSRKTLAKLPENSIIGLTFGNDGTAALRGSREA
ncbi:MAG: hypothetical protein II850_10605 [Fibrobacter sp.]|nr:hypothetical protein [Fibrobacter sp.]